jgi:two-component system response regulator AtoC
VRWSRKARSARTCCSACRWSTIELPPLRDRTGDIPLLVDHFIGELARQHGRTIRGIAPEARTALVRYAWPGNVRELRNVIENMVLLAGGDMLGLEDVPEHVREHSREPRRGGATSSPAARCPRSSAT